MADFNEVHPPRARSSARPIASAVTPLPERRFDKAMADLNEAIKLIPEDYEALFCRGYAYAIKGDLDKALADYDQAIKIEPLLCRGALQSGLGRLGQERRGARPWPTTAK